MARRIFASEFDSNARRMATPLVLTEAIFKDPDSIKVVTYGFKPASIRDRVPVREVTTEPVTLSNFEIPPRPLVTEREERHCHRYAIHTTRIGITRAVFKRIARNRKTIEAKRKELVQLLRHESRTMEQHILKQLDAFDRKEF